MSRGPGLVVCGVGGEVTRVGKVPGNVGATAFDGVVDGDGAPDVGDSLPDVELLPVVVSAGRPMSVVES